MTPMSNKNGLAKFSKLRRTETFHRLRTPLDRIDGAVDLSYIYLLVMNVHESLVSTSKEYSIFFGNGKRF